MFKVEIRATNQENYHTLPHILYVFFIYTHMFVYLYIMNMYYVCLGLRLHIKSYLLARN